MKLIQESKLIQLLIDSEKLRRLERDGVDNWSWYGEAINHDDNGDTYDMEDFEELDLPDILKEYSDYSISSEFDNYNYE